jgi:hypothetical protein
VRHAGVIARPTATAGRTAGSAARFARVAAGALAVVSVAAAGCSSSPATGKNPTGRASVPPIRALAAHHAPAGWHTATLLGGRAVVAYPPAMHLVRGDRGSVSAAQFNASGAYLMYLNATPKQSSETLQDWPGFRIEHLKEELAVTARPIAESRDVRFLGGTGTCVIDAYVTKVKSNHYTELACFVRGQTTSSVIIAAAPTASWAAASPVLMRAVAAYQVQ